MASSMFPLEQTTNEIGASFGSKVPPPVLRGWRSAELAARSSAELA
jgi:hypothetical protein